MTVPRYIAIVSAIYMLALLAIMVLVGEIRTPDALMRLWPVPMASIAIAVLGTLGPIAHFGDAAGSIYFFPTLLHSLVILVLVIVSASVMGR